MGCRFDKAILHQHIDGTIEPLEAIFLQEHLKYCRECEEELKLLSAVDKGLYAVFKEEAMPSEAMDLLIKDICEGHIEKKSKTPPLTKGIKNNAALGWSILKNITRFTKYMPAAKVARTYTKKAVGLGAFWPMKRKSRISKNNKNCDGF